MSMLSRFAPAALAAAVLITFVGLPTAEVSAAKPSTAKSSKAKPSAAKLAMAKVAVAKTTAAETTAVKTPTADSKTAAVGPIGAHAPADSLQTAVRVDQSLAAELSRADATSPGATAAAKQTAPRTDDETFLRRVSLDLVGDSPSPEDVTAFALDPSADKRAKAVDRLLADPRFGENWARYWRDVIMYRRTDERAQIVSPTLVEYLTEQFNRNTPWSQIAREFVTATGDVREKGSTALIMAQMGQAPEIAAETARIFMGVQVQCAQCHDHPTDRWKRKQFHELAAFFPRVDVRADRSGDKRTFQVVSHDFQQRGPRNPNRPNRDIEHYMPDLKDPGAKGTQMQPVLFVTGQKLEVGATDTQRREALAEWLSAKKNPWFAKAFVNRIWAEMVGEGFYEPVDDLGPDRTCSAPKTLGILAKAFATRDYDVKWLYRTIAATEAYQRESRSRREPGEGAPFVANCPQPLRADQLYNALVSALDIKTLDNEPPRGGYGNPMALLRGPRGEFNRTFGFDPSERRDEVASSIPQALVMMNSPVVNRAINARNATSVLGQVLAETKDDEAVATELYLRCLAREPKPDELATCLAHVRETGNRAAAFEDILWALVNSTEFLHRK